MLYSIPVLALVHVADDLLWPDLGLELDALPAQDAFNNASWFDVALYGTAVSGALGGGVCGGRTHARMYRSMKRLT